MMIVLYVLIVIFALSPFLPGIRNPHWFFRTPDFVRIQSFFLLLVLLILFLIFENNYDWFSLLLLCVMSVAIVYEAIKIYPFSRFAPRYKTEFTSNKFIKVFAANVLQDNSQYEKFLSLIAIYDPDIILAMETDSKWESALDQLEGRYPYSVKIPKENYYGMHLYAKAQIDSEEIFYHVEEDVPSIIFDYPLSNHDAIKFYCLHPAPPSPTENDTSIERDAELMKVGKKIRESEQPTVVFGDMNDVVWSRTTRLFRKLTGMIDPRLGRGFFSTYHAKYWFVRFPLDHLFHTKDLYVGSMIRSEYFGSDHFAMYYEIHYKETVPPPENPELSSEEMEEIDDIVQRADEN